jgi:hypothetical protein
MEQERPFYGEQFYEPVKYQCHFDIVHTATVARKW